MPDLPLITLSQAHYDRVVAAFPGADLAKKAAAYQAWTINNLIEFVANTEGTRLEQQFAAQKDAAFTAFLATLPPKLPFPPA